MNAAIQEGKSVEEIAKQEQAKEKEMEVESPPKEEVKTENKVEAKPKPAVNAEGEVIHADSNWKSFLMKSGKKMKPIKKAVEKKVEKKKDSFFDFKKEHSTKKVPLVKKQKK